MLIKDLERYLNTTLEVKNFKDYCPNGLQIQGKNQIKKIITGVSANQELIDLAIQKNADAIIVHHGFFWKNEPQTITGIKKNRIASLLKNDINLFAYHLPLDAHPTLGNNINLANLLGIKNPQPIDGSLVWQGEVDLSLQKLSDLVADKLGRKPLVFGEKTKQISKIAWCSGGAQSYIDKAIEIDADCFITGEVSEQIPAIAKENDIAFISAGHHSTEKGGAQLLARHLSAKFDVNCEFVDVENIV
jgi:dinuclear metal center YbgI/SA1388 family protein